MARQPIETLQGYGQTSSPSAAPIDSFTGAPSVPRETPATQLAQALGTMSSAVARAGANAQAEREKLSAKKAVGYAASFKGEQGEFLDSVKLGETYADLSQTVVATIVEDKYKNEYYNATFERLNNLDDDVKGDVVALENLFEDIITEANEATQGMDFVNSGAIQGARNAINQMRREFSEFRDTETRNLAKANTEASVYNILDKVDLNTNDGQVSAVTLINDLNEKLIATSPFTKTEDKQQIVDALIAYNKTNPDSNAVSLIKKVPWLQSKVTDQKLAEAAPVIAGLSLQKLRDDAEITQLENKQILEDAQSKFNEMALNNDKEGIRKAMAKTTGLTGNDAVLGNAMYKMGEVALASADVEVEDSLKFAAGYESSLVARAIKGELTRTEALEEIAASPDMREEEKQALRGKLDKIMSGNDLIAASKHITEFNNRVGDDARLIDQSIINLEGKLEGRSLESRIRDVWDDTVFGLIQDYVTDNNAVPEGTALRKIYDEAEAITEKRMEKLRGITPPPSGDSSFVVGETYTNPGDGKEYRLIAPDTKDRESWELVDESSNELTEEEMNAEAPDQFTMEDAERIVEHLGLINIDTATMKQALELLNR